MGRDSGDEEVRHRNPAAGRRLTWLSQNIEEDKALARQGWDVCRARILSGYFDLIVLDELTYMLKYHWLTWDEIAKRSISAPPGCTSSSPGGTRPRN